MLLLHYGIEYIKNLAYEELDITTIVKRIL